ncbi:hypothetical protein, partial [Haliangium sp. UPWRP_2]|uniref:hypothetical protein n=1 Tax=Haliangium sp. UPWRP_2 TaxID=1931276 RepID=UPI001E57207E
WPALDRLAAAVFLFELSQQRIKRGAHYVCILDALTLPVPREKIARTVYFLFLLLRKTHR